MRLRDFRRLMSDVFWSPVRCLTASDKDPSTALGMTFVESRSLPFVFIPPWEDPSCAFGAALLQGPTHGADSLSFPFIPPRGFILRLWRAPSPRAYSWSRFTLFSFHSASRIHPAPLARPFSKGLLIEQIHSLFLLYRLEDSSCAFGAALLQGPTHGTESLSFPFIPPRGIHSAPLAQSFSKGLLIEQIHSLFLSFCLEDPSCAFGAALLQGPTHGAESLSFPFIPLRGSILRLWRSPFPRAYSWSRVLSFPFIPLRGSILRLRRGPSPRAYSWSRFTLFSFHSASRNPSCAFGAALLQGPTHGADSLSFPFIPPRGSILRLWRSPFPRAYSWSRFTLFSFYTASRNHPAPLARPFFKGLLN